VRVRDILTLHRDFDGIWPLCGEAGLDNEVRGIEELETYDTAYLTNPGDFVVTSGYCMSNGDASVENWIKIFLQRGVAGLGIKLGLFLDELPLDAYKTANESGFPVLFIPPDLKNEDILRPILSKLLKDEELDIPALDSFKTSLGSMSGGEYTLDSIIGLLRKHINYPIELVWNNSFDPINRQNVLNAYNARNFLRKKINKIHPQEAYAVLTGSAGKYSIFKINSALETMAFLTVLLKSDQSLSRSQVAMIQEALPMLAVCLLSKRVPMPNSPKSPEIFLSDVMDGVYIDREREIKEDASYLKIDFYAGRVLWMVEFAEKDPERYNSCLQAAIEFFDASGWVFTYLHNRTALHKNKPVFISDSNDLLDSKRLRDLLCGMRAHIRKIRRNVQCNVGVSGVAASLDQMGSAYDEAEFSLKMGKRLSERSHIHFYDSYKIYHLLSETWGMPILSGVYKNTMRRLADYDAENKTGLTDLILALNDCGFSISGAAKSLGINRKTMKNRIDLIGRVIGIDIYQPENQIVMKLMSRMKKILD
jgi:purine catabolism regulator